MDFEFDHKKNLDWNQKITYIFSSYLFEITTLLSLISIIVCYFLKWYNNLIISIIFFIVFGIGSVLMINKSTPYYIFKKETFTPPYNIYNKKHRKNIKINYKNIEEIVITKVSINIRVHGVVYRYFIIYDEERYQKLIGYLEKKVHPLKIRKKLFGRVDIDINSKEIKKKITENKVNKNILVLIYFCNIFGIFGILGVIFFVTTFPSHGIIELLILISVNIVFIVLIFIGLMFNILAWNTYTRVFFNNDCIIFKDRYPLFWQKMELKSYDVNRIEAIIDNMTSSFYENKLFIYTKNGQKLVIKNMDSSTIEMIHKHFFPISKVDTINDYV